MDPEQGHEINGSDEDLIKESVEDRESDSEEVDSVAEEERGRDSEEDQEDGNTIHLQLEAIVDEIKNSETMGNWKNEKTFEQETKQWQHFTESSEMTGDCILHLLMKDNAKGAQNKRIKMAIRNIARHRPTLMTRRNNENSTPLFLGLGMLKLRAARIKTGLFPDNMGTERKKQLVDSIGLRCGTANENCLHLAVKNCLDLVVKDKSADTSLLETIISHASRDAINARDIHNRTPLYYAVKYQYSGESTLKIIKSLIKQGELHSDAGDELGPPHGGYAFDAYVTSEKEKLSIYGYHMQTRGNSMSRGLTTKAAGMNDRKDTSKVEQKALPGADKQTQSLSKPGGKAQQKNQGDKSNIGVTRKKAETTENANSDDLPSPMLGRTNTFHAQIEDRTREASSPAVKKQDRKADDQQGAEKLEYWSKKIRHELRLHCLRTRTSAQAERFLYGSNKEGAYAVDGTFLKRDGDMIKVEPLLTTTADIQLFFNYTGLPEDNADPVTFYDNFKQTQFAEVLQYVEFPALRLKKMEIPRGETFKRHKELFQSKSDGRKDLVFFFSWLKDKKVKHIINLKVRDTVDPHSDDAIEACLSGLRIDVLDWSKPDLDPEMLCSACPNVKELHLEWGGNNAILRAWSEPEGLRTLPRLKQIYVYFDQYSDRARKNFEKFKTRFEEPDRVPEAVKAEDGNNKNNEPAASESPEAGPKNDQSGQKAKRRITVAMRQRPRLEAQQSPASTLEAADEKHNAMTVHKWLESVDAFGDQLKTLMANIRTRSHQGDDIKVALIDDGVDMCEKEFREKIMDGKSFAHYPYDNNREKQWYVSELGHGTVMAHMILRVCPMAKIIPIKLDTWQAPNKKHRDIRTQSAIRAIETAVEKNVDIISMSWTVEKPKGDEKAAFDSALQKAEDARILMFCSSPDEGVFSSEHYPTAWGLGKFFRIGASQATGIPYNRVSLSQVDYLFPGVDVVRANKRDLALRGLDDHTNTFTGSSVSTALAAGLAALALWFVIIGARYSRDENQGDVLDDNDVKKLRDITAMKHAFQYLGAGRGPNDKFVEIWSVLEPAAQTLKEHRGHAAEDVRASRRKIFDMARDMVRKS